MGAHLQVSLKLLGKFVNLVVTNSYCISYLGIWQSCSPQERSIVMIVTDAFFSLITIVCGLGHA